MRQGGRGDDEDDENGTLAFKKKRPKTFGGKKRIRNESKRVNAVGSDAE